jgi:hypothetical protein
VTVMAQQHNFKSNFAGIDWCVTVSSGELGEFSNCKRMRSGRFSSTLTTSGCIRFSRVGFRGLEAIKLFSHSPHKEKPNPRVQPLQNSLESNVICSRLVCL